MNLAHPCPFVRKGGRVACMVEGRTMRQRHRFDGWGVFAGAGCAIALIWYLGNGMNSSEFPLALTASSVTLGALALRSRMPFLAIALAIVGAVAAGFVDTPPVQLWVAVQLILLSVAKAVGRRRSIGPAVAVGVALFGCEIVIYGEPPFGGVALGVISWTLGVWGLAAAISSARREANEWEDHARHLQRTREEEIRRHIVEERLRIARDLHDELGHDIAVIGINAGAAEAGLGKDPEGVRASLRTVRASTRRALVELQQILGVLRADRENSSPPGTIAELLDAARRSGLVVHSAEIDAAGLAPDGATAVYRVIQEAVTNAGRHGSGAVTIEASSGDGIWRLTIQNPVNGTSAPGGGFGLIGMRERVEQASGKLRISANHESFTLAIELPASGVTAA